MADLDKKLVKENAGLVNDNDKLAELLKNQKAKIDELASALEAQRASGSKLVSLPNGDLFRTDEHPDRPDTFRATPSTLPTASNMNDVAQQAALARMMKAAETAPAPDEPTE